MKDLKIEFYFKEYKDGVFEDALDSLKYLDLQPQCPLYLSGDESRAKEDALHYLMIGILHLDLDTVKHLNLYDTLSMYYFDTIDNNEDTVERKRVLEEIFVEHRFILTKKTYWQKNAIALDFTVVNRDDEPYAYNAFTGHDF